MVGGLLVGDPSSLQLRMCLGGDLQGREEAARMMLTALSKEEESFPVPGSHSAMELPLLCGVNHGRLHLLSIARLLLHPLLLPS